MRRAGLIALTVAAAAFGQSFDVASVRPSSPAAGSKNKFGGSGGPGTSDPGLFTCENCTLMALLMLAYDLKPYQISGPEALKIEMFNVTARLPGGATKEQFRAMLRNLLAERFRMAVHHEAREMPVYDLVVTKNGPKFKESADQTESPAGPAAPVGKLPMGDDGFPVLPKRPGPPTTIMMNGRASTQATASTMDQLALMLSGVVGNRPVNDATALKRRYDFTISWAPDMPASATPAAAPEADALPGIFAALQEQLGLKLEPKKGTVDMLVVDRTDKKPAEN